ncbi:MAG: VIT1/CCC1 transporter family protein, partial [Nostocoides sp.]
PLLSIVLLAPNLRIPLTLVAGVLVLAGTGWLSARLGDAPPRPAILRNAAGGALAMAVTYLVGTVTGQAVG